MSADDDIAQSSLTHRLLMRVTSYFEEQLAVLEERKMSSAEMSRWFNQTLDNVRLRHRKLLRFGRWVVSALVEKVYG